MRQYAPPLTRPKSLGGTVENQAWHLRRSVAGATDEERVCRHVIAWTCDLLQDQPERAEALQRRLEAEIESVLRDSSNPL